MWEGQGYDDDFMTPDSYSPLEERIRRIGRETRKTSREEPHKKTVKLVSKKTAAEKKAISLVEKAFKSTQKIVAGSDFPLNYLLSNVKYPIRDSEEKLNYDLTLKIRVGKSQYFIADVRNVFSDVPIKHTTAKESHEWLRSPNMRYWPQKLNFAVWCATAGCGVGYDMMKEESIMAFHFHFTVRRILYELSVSLPGDSGFDAKNNNYNKVACQRLCKEFKIPENTDFRFPGYNIGLGYVMATGDRML